MITKTLYSILYITTQIKFLQSCKQETCKVFSGTFSLSRHVCRWVYIPYIYNILRLLPVTVVRGCLVYCLKPDRLCPKHISTHCNTSSQMEIIFVDDEQFRFDYLWLKTNIFRMPLLEDLSYLIFTWSVLGFILLLFVYEIFRFLIFKPFLI